MAISRWVRQAPGLSNLTFVQSLLLTPLGAAREAYGRLRGRAESIGADDLVLIERDVWVGSAMATAAIEGDRLNLEAVRSSVAARLGLDASTISTTPRNVDVLLDIMNDAVTHWQEPLTEATLITWQTALCGQERPGLPAIETGRLRTHDVEIVSGPEGRRIVHFQGPPAHTLHEEMQVFLDWFNDPTVVAELDGIVRAGLAHLWFETIHPFADGNGRIGRAIVDRAIAQDARRPSRLHGVSMQIHSAKKGYYDALNAAQRGSGDVTPWLAWFIDTFAESCRVGLILIDEALVRTRFWNDHRNVVMNARQRKALTRMLAAGAGRFAGGMTPKKYLALTRANNRLTASRDLADLVEKKLLRREGAGRSTYYDLAIPGWGWTPTAAARRRSVRASP